MLNNSFKIGSSGNRVLLAINQCFTDYFRIRGPDDLYKEQQLIAHIPWFILPDSSYQRFCLFRFTGKRTKLVFQFPDALVFIPAVIVVDDLLTNAGTDGVAAQLLLLTVKDDQAAILLYQRYFGSSALVPGKQLSESLFL